MLVSFAAVSILCPPVLHSLACFDRQRGQLCHRLVQLKLQEEENLLACVVVERNACQTVAILFWNSGLYQIFSFLKTNTVSKGSLELCSGNAPVYLIFYFT